MQKKDLLVDRVGFLVGRLNGLLFGFLVVSLGGCLFCLFLVVFKYLDHIANRCGESLLA